MRAAILTLILVQLALATASGAPVPDRLPLPGALRSRSKEPEKRRARALFNRAEAQYRLRHFEEAVSKYRAALKLWRHPSIIFNIAQCYRYLDNHKKALFYYKLFLSDWARLHSSTKPPNDAEVRRHIAALERRLRDGSKPLVAVLRIRSGGAPFKTSTLVKMGDYLSSRLAAEGAYVVVPRKKVKKKLATYKLDSYSDSNARARQIALGKELAANKVLSTRIMKIGRTCVVTAMLLDLESATAQRSAVAKEVCSEEGALRAIDVVVKKLSRAAAAAGKQPATKPRKLSIRVWTSKQTYRAGEKLRVHVRASSACHLRLVYHQADGTSVQIFPNALHRSSRVRGGATLVIPGPDDAFELEVGKPFGRESITAFAGARPFDGLDGRVLKNGLKVLSGSAAQVRARTRGARVKTRGVRIKRKRRKDEYAEARVRFKTRGGGP